LQSRFFVPDIAPDRDWIFIMRILLVGINYAPDLIGIAKYNTELCESLAADGHQVQAVTAPPYYPAWQIPPGFRSRFFRGQAQNGVRVTRTPIYVPASPSGAKRLLHHASFAISSAGPALVKAVSWRPQVMISIAPSLLSAALVALTARLTGAKSWLHVQDFEVDAAFDLGLLRSRRLRAPMLMVERWIMQSFDRVSTISPQMLRRLRVKGVDAGRLREVRNWIDTRAIVPGDRQTGYRAELGMDASHLVGLYSGTMSNKQGLDLIIDAAALLEKSHPHVQFVLCGEGPHRSHLIEMAAGRRNIRFLHLQPMHRFGELLATADFHIIPQKAEVADLVLPSKLGGILSSARPVIVMAERGTALANEVLDAGLVVPPGDSAGLATAICRLNDDPALRQALGDQARRRALDKWDQRGIVNELSREIALLAFDPSHATAAEAGLSDSLRSRI
jgi:putative colanic acid biosynthesis glycosyltransferase WcaI